MDLVLKAIENYISEVEKLSHKQTFIAEAN